MTEHFDLANYMNESIEIIIRDILKGTFKNPRETAFLLKYKEVSKRNFRKRNFFEASGQHIPTFLISSITNACNLFCKGCYARDNGMCNDEKTAELLTAAQWLDIFRQSKDLGISFNLLAGGEPLLRRDVIQAAASVKNTIFPIFTNGVLIDADYLKLFNAHRNLIPVLSLEGNQPATDFRRGKGTYLKLLTTMKALDQHKIVFGTSITVTTENRLEVTSKEFLDVLAGLGCRIVFFIEYVPVDPATEHLAPGEKERLFMENRQNELREVYDSMVFVSFPGDEQFMGGCLAAGRGFFHINPYGSAEACPFSPYSDRSLKEHTILEVLSSPFFEKLQEQELVGGEHNGGCALFQQEDLVKALLNS
ncbi:radical SAM protein [Acetobacterium bakii]|uniref:Radical SAM protein n=1 Tax=Acetobacterium bakii TaxID=52689 RepID=A0A0L6TW73_9FIRM|nr:radical SAM protein [Acetobacterium bakii]KNZ40317.1 radical SAM protein [Acetobacterium bakii]